MTLKPKETLRPRGFALIVTLVLMILLTVIAVGLLSLSAISLRSTSNGEADARAFANARLAVLMAIGELQNEVGDDRRITADASILPSAKQSHLVGTWSSWSPGFASNPDQSAPDYAEPKVDLFRSWMVSAPDPMVLKIREWAESNVDPDWIRLFSDTRDGYDLSAPQVPTRGGSYAWAVSQENTKAKINVGGAGADLATNSALQVQPRPSLALSATLKQPEDGWNRRADRVISLDQVALDSDLVADPSTLSAIGSSFTTSAQGLLTDVVNGGLKIDLSLGFELADSDFEKASWNGIPNPFRSPNPTMGFSSPGSYDGQRALFRPLIENPIVSKVTDYSEVKIDDRFYAAAVPTFEHLRSFYRIPYHLYGGSSPTVAWRGADHVASSIPSASAGTQFSPSKPPDGTTSSLAIRPILNRMIYLLSVKFVRPGGGTSPIRIRLVLTPIIALWNPYNTALETQGAYAFPWMDLPFQMTWKKNGAPFGDFVVAVMMGQEKKPWVPRQADPYFRCNLSADGNDMSKVIRFEPGEVRLFVPSSPTPTLFKRRDLPLENRSVNMRPVADIQDINLTGGFEIPMEDGIYGKTLPALRDTDKVTLKIDTYEQQGQGYHYFVSLVDAALGQAISDVQILNLTSASLPESAPMLGSGLLDAPPRPYAVIETFHRTAKTIGGSSNADLMYTTNPRQPSINHQLAAGSFSVAPHYQSSLRSVASFNGAIQTSFDGRRSFWGATNSPPEGKDYLPFFEIPREPLLSLASFQSADLASSAFSSANQFANSWASPYLGLAKAASATTKYANPNPPIINVPIYDTPLLTNEALWDGFFFSGAAPTLSPASGGSPATAWKNPLAKVDRSLTEVVTDFVSDPVAKPLANSRMRLDKAGLADQDLVKLLLDPEGCTRIAAHLTVDGAFNVNSTDVEAWTALLSGLRGEAFQVEGGTPPSPTETAFPRFRHPTGQTNDNWNGFRVLDDDQIRNLAENLVEEIRLRGPFLSLGEFINRRVEDSDLGKSGAIQSAIDAGGRNKLAEQESFSTANYPSEARNHIIADTGVGVPGYLTQADVLQSLAPVITVRSDTFTIRGYGEATDAAGKVIARSWCEAVVQRTPEFVDPADAVDAAIASITPTNQTFGRRFEIISFRRLSNAETQ
jgi:hypothetical protein